MHIKFIVPFNNFSYVNFYNDFKFLLNKYYLVDAYFIYLNQRIYVLSLNAEFFNNVANWLGIQQEIIIFTFIKQYQGNERLMYDYFTEYNQTKDIILLPLNWYTKRIIYWDGASLSRGIGNNYYNIFSTGRTTISYVHEGRLARPTSGGSTAVLQDSNGNQIRKLGPNGIPLPSPLNIIYPINFNGLAYVYVPSTTLPASLVFTGGSGFNVTFTQSPFLATNSTRSYEQNLQLTLWGDSANKVVTHTQLDYIQLFQDAFIGNEINPAPVSILPFKNFSYATNSLVPTPPAVGGPFFPPTFINLAGQTRVFNENCEIIIQNLVLPDGWKIKLNGYEVEPFRNEYGLIILPNYVISIEMTPGSFNYSPDIKYNMYQYSDVYYSTLVTVEYGMQTPAQQEIEPSKNFVVITTPNTTDDPEIANYAYVGISIATCQLVGVRVVGWYTYEGLVDSTGFNTETYLLPNVATATSVNRIMLASLTDENPNVAIISKKIVFWTNLDNLSNPSNYAGEYVSPVFNSNIITTCQNNIAPTRITNVNTTNEVTINTFKQITSQTQPLPYMCRFIVQAYDLNDAIKLSNQTTPYVTTSNPLPFTNAEYNSNCNYGNTIVAGTSFEPQAPLSLQSNLSGVDYTNALPSGFNLFWSGYDTKIPIGWTYSPTLTYRNVYYTNSTNLVQFDANNNVAPFQPLVYTYLNSGRKNGATVKKLGYYAPDGTVINTNRYVTYVVPKTGAVTKYKYITINTPVLAQRNTRVLFWQYRRGNQVEQYGEDQLVRLNETDYDQITITFVKTDGTVFTYPYVFVYFFDPIESNETKYPASYISPPFSSNDYAELINNVNSPLVYQISTDNVTTITKVQNLAYLTNQTTLAGTLRIQLTANTISAGRTLYAQFTGGIPFVSSTSEAQILPFNNSDYTNTLNWIYPPTKGDPFAPTSEQKYCGVEVTTINSDEEIEFIFGFGFLTEGWVFTYELGQVARVGNYFYVLNQASFTYGMTDNSFNYGQTPSISAISFLRNALVQVPEEFYIINRAWNPCIPN